VQQLLEYLPSASLQERRAVSDLIYEKRSDTLPHLRNIISTSSDQRMRLFACSMIAEMGDKDSTDLS
jgi:hypothetical protein